MSRYRLSAAASLAVLLLAALPQPSAAQYFGKNKIQYRTFDWQIYHSTHFDIYYYTDEEVLLEKIVSFAESAYDNLSREFDYQIKEPTPLIFYATHSAFEQNNIILNFIPEGTGAFASPVRNRMVLPVDVPDPELMALILHELTHIFQYHILFGGSLGKGVASTPPIWAMEGMASYMAKDETARDRMYLRDAVVNDRIPSVSDNFGGFFAYRFGHAVFDFMEERWGREGFRDFLVELRNTLGARVDRAIKRAFRMEPEDFDSEFRRWLRQKYLVELVQTGEPSDFGRPFRVGFGSGSQETSPAASPSGDLVAAFSTERGDVDVVLFDTRERTMVANLTKGYSKKFQYLVAQELTLGRDMGRDLAFSPDGNQVAVFAKRERGRSLVLIDVLKRKVRDVIDLDPALEQQLAPAFSPDGSRVAFAAFKGGQFDIFELDLATREVTNVTDDEIYDGAPTYSPDGKDLYFSSAVGEGTKIFRVALADRGARYQVTYGDSIDVDAVLSGDGRTLFFTSDRTGANNVFSLALDTGEIRQHTNSVTGCFMPTVLRSPDGHEGLVYAAFWKGRFDLYRLDLDEPVTPPKVVAAAGEAPTTSTEPVAIEELPRYEPAIEVAVDPANTSGYGGFKFFLEDISIGLAVSDDQTFIGDTLVTFSDYLGDRRILAAFQSVESFQNFDVIYADLSRRLQWQAHLFDNRDFFIGVDNSTGFLRRGRSALSQTGAIVSLIYPLSFYHRLELGGGYILRDIDYQAFGFDQNSGQFVPVIQPRKDDYPQVQAALVGDSALFESWGPVKGRRYRLSADYAPDLDAGGTLTRTLALDFRQYLSLTRRMQFALRGVGAKSDGSFPSPFYFGGLDTLRGFDFRSLVGDRAFYANLEVRFPLVDVLATPILNFQGIRGVVFLDVGGAWFKDITDFTFWNGDENRLEDAVGSYGWGLTIRFLGLDLNWDFAKQWDFKESLSGFRTSFWIGQRF